MSASSPSASRSSDRASSRRRRASRSAERRPVYPKAARRLRRVWAVGDAQLTIFDVLASPARALVVPPASVAAARAPVPLPPPQKPRLSPPARMVELLTVEKRACLAAAGEVTVADFDTAWQRCWMVMVDERAWPHATELRRQWRTSMRLARAQYREAFLSRPASVDWSLVTNSLLGPDDSHAAARHTSGSSVTALVVAAADGGIQATQVA